MEIIKFFAEPVQVKFVDFDSSNEDSIRWMGGIAYYDEIICGCCGGTINLEEFWEDWFDFGEEEYGDLIEDRNPLHIYNDWVDIEESIRD